MSLLLVSQIVIAQTTYIGPSNGDWNVVANWNNGLPASGNNALIPGGVTVNINSAQTINYTIDAYGKLCVNAPVINTGTINSSVELEIKNTLTNNNIINSYAKTTIATTGTLTNAASTTFTANGYITNNGTINNGGQMTMYDTICNKNIITNTGTFEVAKVVINEKTMTNNPTGLIKFNSQTYWFNKATGVVQNNATVDFYGQLFNDGIIRNAGNFTNYKTINNNNLFYIDNGGTLTSNVDFINNDSLIINTGGTVVNINNLTNNKFICNYNVLDNRANFYNKAPNGVYDGKSGSQLLGGYGSVFENNNIVTLAANTTFNTFGTITNTGNFTNLGTMTTNTGPAFTNSGTYTNGGTLITNNAVNTSGAFINNGTYTINSGSVLTNSGNFTNSTTGTVTNLYEFVNSSSGTFTNNGRFLNNVRVFIEGTSSVNNAYIENIGDFTVRAGGNFTNKEAFLQIGGNLCVNGTFTNQKTFLSDECSTVVNKGVISNTGSFTYRGILFQRGTVSGTLTNDGGFIQTNTTSSAPTLCVTNKIFPTTQLGEVKVYANELVTNTNIDACSNFIYRANGLARPLFSCAQVNTTQSLSFSLVTRLGDSLTCTATVLPKDSLAPIFNNCPSDIVVYTNDTTAVATWTAPTATDNCTAVTLTPSHTSGTRFPLGITGVSYTAKDAYGNTNLCQFRIDVRKIGGTSNCTNDVTGPVFSNCPSNIVTTSTSSAAQATWTPPTVADNCLPIYVSSNYSPGAYFRTDTTYTVIYTAKDNNNNTSTCSFTVRINQTATCTTDTQKPSFDNCPTNIYLPTNTTLNGAVAIWTAPGVSDNCGVQSVTANYQTGTVFPVGTTTVTYTAKDNANNTATCTFTVTVGADPCPGDVSGPAISGCPSNINLTTTGTSAVATWATPNAADACGGITLNSTHTSGSAFPVGGTVVTYTASDKKGNKSTCTFTVTVTNTCASDLVAPTINGCPADITVAAINGGATVTWTAPTATDNCGLASFSSQYLPGAFFYTGVTTVIYTAIDLKGNIKTCSFKVNIVAATGCATNSAPANNATGLPINGVVLSWGSVSGAISYDVYFGTATIPTTLVANVTGNTYTVNNLAYGTNYYWYVVPKNIAGGATGCSPTTTKFTTVVPAPSCTSNTSPSNGAIGISTPTTTLTWVAAANATSYDLYFGTASTPTTLLAGSIAGTSYQVNNLQAGTTYYWYVVPKNISGTATGCTSSITRFTTVISNPGCVNSCTGNLLPEGCFELGFGSFVLSGSATLAAGYIGQGATICGSTSKITKTVAATAATIYTLKSYALIDNTNKCGKIQIDFLNAAGTILSSQVATLNTSSYTLYTLQGTSPAGTTQIRVSAYKCSNGGCIRIDEMCLTGGVPTPSCATLSSPVNGATGIGTSTALSWAAVSGATSYDVYVGTSTTTPALVGNTTTNSYTVTNLTANTTYRWYVVPKNASSAATGCNSNIYSFTTAVTVTIPSCATLSSPVNGATGIGTSTALSWAAVSGATSYDVYFGTSTATYLTNVTTTSYTVSNLTAGTTYRWYVVPRNSAGAASGCSTAQRTFTTATNCNQTIECEAYYNGVWSVLSNCSITVNAGTALTLSVNPSVATNWTGPNGFTSTNNNDPLISSAITTTQAGVYNATLVYNGCTYTKSITVYVNATTTCNNFTSGGTIGSDQTICSGASASLTNVTSPSGGSGTAEYLWLQWTSQPPTDGSNTGATVVSNSNSATLNTGTLTQTTWYRRCSRRQPCTGYDGESNIIKVTVNSCNTVSCTGNLITTNSSFESDFTGYWNYNNLATIVSSSNTGSKAVSICTDGGFGLTKPAVAGKTYTFNAYAKTTGTPSYKGIYLEFFTSSWIKLAQHTSNINTSSTYSQYTISQVAPVGTAYVQVFVWAGPGGCTIVDDFCLIEETPTCNNFTSGGTIGSDQTICSGASASLTNVTSPSGGSGTAEYLWLQWTSQPPTDGSNTGATVVSNSNSATLNTGTLTQTTWYRRCSRRQPCTGYDGESNIIKVTVNSCNTVSCTGNLITTNSSFESDFTGYWNYNNLATIVSSSNTGSKAVSICTDGGFGLTKPAVAGKTYTFNAYAKTTGTPSYKGIYLEFFTSSWIKLAQHTSNINTSSTYSQYTISQVAPVGTAYVQVFVWAGPGGCTIVDDFCLTETTTASCVGTRGNLLLQTWDNVTGYAITDLTNNSAYPNSPTSSRYILNFQKPTSNAADNYGDRAMGYIYAPTTGTYYFTITGDDFTELYLSTNTSPSSKSKIAWINDWTYANEFNKFSTQRSIAITLQANTPYYVELLHKESYGGDHFAVYWEGPGITRTLVPGSALAPYVCLTNFREEENSTIVSEQVSDVKAFTLFPNPNSGDNVYLQLDEYVGAEAVITISNALGQVLSQQEIPELPYNAVELDVAKLTNGIYQVTVQVKGRAPQTKRLIISKL